MEDRADAYMNKRMAEYDKWEQSEKQINNQSNDNHQSSIYDNQNKGITTFRERAAENQDDLQNAPNKGLESFREKASGNHNTAANEARSGHTNDTSVGQSGGQSM